MTVDVAVASLFCLACTPSQSVIHAGGAMPEHLSSNALTLLMQRTPELLLTVDLLEIQMVHSLKHSRSMVLMLPMCLIQPSLAAC